MTVREHHFEVIVPVDEDGVPGDPYLNAENSASSHDGTVWDVDEETWVSITEDGETWTADCAAGEHLQAVLNRGTA